METNAVWQKKEKKKKQNSIVRLFMLTIKEISLGYVAFLHSSTGSY